ncbi:MAG TPA: hypothetical protein VED40_00875 [Azospirillaceae bacterium]|nr:hypothetical protein [Azospirillaceae bacterium]
MPASFAAPWITFAIRLRWSTQNRTQEWGAAKRKRTRRRSKAFSRGRFEG